MLARSLSAVVTTVENAKIDTKSHCMAITMILECWTHNTHLSTKRLKLLIEFFPHQKQIFNLSLG